MPDRVWSVPEAQQTGPVVIAILGGSAHSTPALIECLAAAPLRRRLTVRLAGRDEGSLSAVARACSILAQGTGIKIEQFGADRWDHALSGSHIVLVQIRVGQYEGRHFDETFPLRYGIPGDEGLGPGGLSAVHRSWRVLKPLFTRIRACAPEAQTILLSSPAGLLVRLANLEFPGWPLLALCELPFTTLQHICGIAGIGWEKVTFEYAGVNHLGWLYDVARGGEDLLQSRVVLDQLHAFPSARLVLEHGAFPLPYLRLHFGKQAVVQEQLGLPQSRAEELTELGARSLQMFRSGDRQSIVNAMRARSVRWYSHSIAALLRAYTGEETGQPFFLSVPSPSGDVREHCYYARNGRLQAARPKRAPPPMVSQLIDRFVRYEHFAAHAIMDASEQALCKALKQHPWIDSSGNARALARDIAANSNARGST